MSRPKHVLSCWICLATAALFAFLASHVREARADWPPNESLGTVNYADASNWPNDPGFPGAWELWSFLPAAVEPRATEENKRLGSGTHVDAAWAKTTGDRRVLISVLDSGIEWESDDLVNKWHLNAGELPTPDSGCPVAKGSTSAHDVNGDGIFNVQDYTTVTGHGFPRFTKDAMNTVCDTRLVAMGDTNGNGFLDPEDLIAAFSDDKDDDANGYVDDISGWDFFHNDNDPYDDTRYGHGTGESNDSSAEGENGRGGIGTCPDCTVQILRVGDSFVTDSNMFGMAVLYATDNGTSVIQEALGTLSNSKFSKQAMDYAYANNVAIIASAADEDSFHHNMPGTNNHTFLVHAITYDSNDWHSATTFLNYNNCTNYGAQLMASVSGSACSSEATGKLSGIAGLVYSAALKADVPGPTGAPFAGDPNGVRRLTAEEVYQVLKETVDDLYDPADATDPTKYETRIGWEQRFGYGRINARGAVDAVMSGKLPPEVEVRSPEWFQVLYPERTGKVTIDGRIGVNHMKPGDTFDWVLEWAPGTEPDDSAFKSIATGSMMSQPIDGPIADWDISQLTIDNPTQGPPDNLTNRREVTLRIRATVHSMDMRRDGTKGEFRKAVFIEHDKDLLAGWPIHLGGSGESSGKFVDLAGDGKRELVIADSDGFVHAFKFDGTELAGWPVRTNFLPTVDPNPIAGQPHTSAPAFTKGGINKDLHGQSAFSLAAGDIDGDKKPEVVVATYDGYVYAFHGDGTVAAGFPFVIDHSTRTQTTPSKIMYEGVQAAPVLVDVNGDGKLEIVVATMNALLYVLGGDGKPLSTWNGGKPLVIQDPTLSATSDPQQLRDRIMSSPAVGDLTGDGVPDFVFGTNENYDNEARLYAVDGAKATFLPGWPVSVVSNYILPFVGSGMPNAPAMADLNGDKVPEIIVGGIAGGARTYDKNGKQFGRIYPNSANEYGALSDARNATSIVLIANPSIGDIDDDGVLDVVQPTGGGDAAVAFASGGQRRDFEHHVAAWDTQTGAFKKGFPRVIEDWQFFNNPTIADIDGDGHSEVLEASAGYWVHAFRADGTEPTGFPKLTGGWVTQSVVVGDMDGDGKLEYAVGTRDGWLYAWEGGGSSKGRVDWASFHHDNANTGNYDAPLDVGGAKGSPSAAGPDGGSTPATGGGGGCSCALARSSRLPGPALGALSLLALGLLSRRRRR